MGLERTEGWEHRLKSPRRYRSMFLFIDEGYACYANILNALRRKHDRLILEHAFKRNRRGLFFRRGSATRRSHAFQNPKPVCQNFTPRRLPPRIVGIRWHQHGSIQQAAHSTREHCFYNIVILPLDKRLMFEHTKLLQTWSSRDKASVWENFVAVIGQGFSEWDILLF